MPAVYLTSRVKQSPVVDGRYLSAGDRIDELGFDDAYVQKLLASGQATTTPPGERPPPEMMSDPLPAWQGRPPGPTPGVKPAWLASDFEGVWPDGAGRIYEPGARIDLYAPNRVADMIASGRATHSKPKVEGVSWRVTALGGVTADGKATAAPISGNRTEIEDVRRPGAVLAR
jgi:hypothetical protein